MKIFQGENILSFLNGSPVKVDNFLDSIQFLCNIANYDVRQQSRIVEFLTQFL